MLDNEETTDNELRTKFSQRWSRTPSGDLYKPLRSGMPRKIVALICCWCWALFKNFLFIGALHTERAAKEQQEIPNLLDTNLSCKFMRCKKPSLSPSNPLPTQRALTSATSWTRQCRPTRWWGTATTPTVTWSPCCVNQRTSSTPPSPLPTRPRHYRAARSVWHLYIFVCELKYWECAFFLFFFYVCVP